MKRLLLVLILLGVGLTGLAYYLSGSSWPRWLGGHASAKNAEAGYAFASVERGDLTETISATGVLQPRDLIAVGSELPGQVVKLYPEADFNQMVKEGDPLLELDPRNSQDDLNRARAAHQEAHSMVQAAEKSREAAQKNLEVKQDLLAKGVGMKKEEEQAKLQLQAAEAQVDAARAKVQEADALVAKAELGLKLNTVRAPADGMIIDRKVVLGQLIGPPLSAQLLTIAPDLGHLQLHAQIAEGDISKVRPGLKAQFHVYAYADTNTLFQGTLTQVRMMPTNLQGAVFYDGIIDVDNRYDPNFKSAQVWMLRPGMTATVDIIRRVHKDVWKMPTSALNFQLDEQYQSPAARQKIQKWEARPDHDDWQIVWVMKDHQPWPVFVRVGGLNEAGEVAGIAEGQYKEVLEWDPDLSPPPDAQNPATYPQVINSAPPAHKSGFFDQVKLKIS